MRLPSILGMWLRLLTLTGGGVNLGLRHLCFTALMWSLTSARGDRVDLARLDDGSVLCEGAHLRNESRSHGITLFEFNALERDLTLN